MQRTASKLSAEVTKISTTHETFFQDASEIYIQNVACSFKFCRKSNFYYPIHGDYNTLGVVVLIKEYSFAELIKLAGGGRVELTFDKLVENVDIFDVIPIKWIDFSATITLLEERGLVRTQSSKSFIANDERVFKLSDTDDWFEVDILGTQFGQDLTEKVLSLYALTHLKDDAN